jgi:hypothetical protein
VDAAVERVVAKPAEQAPVSAGPERRALLVFLGSLLVAYLLYGFLVYLLITAIF